MVAEVRSAYMDIVERAAVEDGRYRVTIAANESARTQPDLDLGGLSTDGYARNPVVMWAHDAVGRSPSGGLPIGRTVELDRGPGGRIVAEFEFLEGDPFAQRVRNAWDQGFLRAASISWLPLESRPVDGGRLRDTRSELLEWSIVAVPADPDALRESQRLLISAYVEEESVEDDGAELGEIGAAVGRVLGRLVDSWLVDSGKVGRGDGVHVGVIGPLDTLRYSG